MKEPLIFNNEVVNNEEINLESDKETIKKYIDSGKLESYSITTNKKGTVVAIKIKM